MPDITTLIEHARANVEAGNPLSAEVYYSLIHRDTSPPRSGIARVARGEACVFFAQKALANDRIGEALDFYREALDADPACADYRVDMAMRVYLPMGMLDPARIEAKRATQLEPDNVRAWRALAGVEHEAGNAEASRKASDRALELAPDDAKALLCAATLAVDIADYVRAREFLGRMPAESRADAMHCEAMILYREGDHLAAIDKYSEAIAAGPQDPHMVRWNRALPRHSIGDYANGWEDFEARADQTTTPGFSTPCKRFVLPIWRGEPPPARLHLHEEMGFGDTLALARYAPLLAERGYDVRIEVREELLELFRHSFPAVKVVPKAIDYPRGLGIPAFDYHCPLLSIPHAVGMTVDTVHWSGPYLIANPVKTAKWRASLRLPGEELAQPLRHVGLAWSSGIRDGLWLKEYGLRKSIPFGQLMPLFHGQAHGDYRLVSLQAGPEAFDNKCILSGLKPGVDYDWHETAALIAALDLVVTVDTAVAHLAGAMGKPVWLMQHTEGSWHWMTKRNDSPWYPTARLFRQEHAHDWAAVIERVTDELRAV
jgi:tetratricopeptide (TPR) repeat protein